MTDEDDVSIKVMCRFRPLNKAETAREDKYLPKYISDNQVSFSGKTYNFDSVFDSKTKQIDLYEKAAKPVVTDVLQGFNGTIFAYGQTGAGKTFSMDGVLHDQENRGVIPRIVEDIFEHIYTLDESLEFHIKISYFEIYLNKIRDLLDVTKQNLAVHEDANRVPFVKGATERFVASPEEVMQVMDEGKMNKKVASTKMNADSSRSHSIFLINVKQENLETQTKLTGKLYLVDLAGSEKVGKTGAAGETLEEAKNINSSLSALGNVISALASGTKTHVPYRDSKMTRILQDSLGGNCRTTIIICCSPAEYNEAETKSTLLFGVRAKTIKNSVVANVELTADQWRKKYEKMEARAKKYEKLFKLAYEECTKWRNGETVENPIDFSDKAGALEAAKKVEADATTPEAVKKDVAFLDSPCTSSLGTLEKAEKIKERVIYKDSGNADVEGLYKEMDEKDDQIAELTQLVEKLKVQLMENEELMISNKADTDLHGDEIARLQEELETSKTEVQEVLAALEDLAVNYDDKAQQVDTQEKEFSKLANELQDKKNSLSKLQSELATVNELSETHKRRASEMLAGLLKDLYEMGLVSPSQIAQGLANNSSEKELETAEPGTFTAIDDEFTTARLLVSKVKAEVKTLLKRCENNDQQKVEKQNKTEEYEKELYNTKLKLSQQENKVITLQSCLKDVENKRRNLEDNISELHEEITLLREALEIQSQNHKKQLDRLRDEVREKTDEKLELEAKARDMESEVETYKQENETLQVTKSCLEKKLNYMETLREKRLQAKEDLNGLNETVARELNSLHSVREMFVKELTERARKIALNDQKGGSSPEKEGNSESSDGFGMGSQVQRHRIQFLESNLDQLTKVHKTLVRDNSELRCELPKLEKKLRATAMRVENLEHALRDAKDGASRDRKRYQQEVDRIKETVRNRYIARKAQIGAQIARPIRAGHAPGATFNINNPVAIRGGGDAVVRGIRGGGN